ncbi:MAG TPA: hypothetical protein DCZ43_09875 [candidate division Zixibacteria bacterium]|nr:hypothetical protein [candidate division Zixibacteria bacterium]
MKKIVLLTILICAGNLWAISPSDFRAHVDTVIDNFARFDPVWGTMIGIHTYDGYLAGLSKKSIDTFTKYLESEKDFISNVDVTNWPDDDQIDQKLILANIKFLLFQYKTFPYWKKSPSVYSDQCLYGIYYLMLRDFAPLEMRMQAVISRINKIPGVCREAKANLTEPVPIFVETAGEALDEGIKLIDDVCLELSTKFPNRATEIKTAKDKAEIALRDLNLYCRELKQSAKGNYAIGKKNLEFLLSDVHLIDTDSDSLLALGNNLYAQTDSEMAALEAHLPPADTMPRYGIPSLSKDDVLSYYRWEIAKMKDYVIQSNYATIPDNFGQCIPMETPTFMRGIIRGIAYEPPAPLDSFQNGFFYVRPLPDTFSEKQKADQMSFIYRRGFRGSIVHEGYPGHHLQLLLANHNQSKIRKIQQDNVLVEGWALYCEEMVYKQGLYGDDPRQWDGVLGGIRFRAVRIIVDIGLQTGRFTPQTALDFMNEKLGKNDYYYTAEIRRYCANPTQALSYLTGKTMILHMQARAQAKEGDKFDLKHFHDRLLSEGSISPTLIAQKYGW